MFHRALTVKLTEEDYFACSLFTSIRNLKQNKSLHNSAIIVLVCGVILMALNILDLYSGSLRYLGVGFVTYGVLMLGFQKQLQKPAIKQQIKSLKKQGKLPYEPEYTMEFGEDSLREISHTQITELSYTALEQICVIPNKVVYIYKTPITAYIIPMSAFTSVEECHALLRFLQSKKPGLPVHFCAE